MSAMLNHAEALHIAIAAINYAIKSLPVDSVEATKLEGKLTQIKELVAE